MAQWPNCSWPGPSKPVTPPTTVPGESFRECSECPEMVVIPAGSFTMGSPEDEEGRYEYECVQRTVTIDKLFAMGKHEVTFDQWDACVSAGGCKLNPPDTGDEGWGRGDRPVINVSWLQANEYADWLSRKTGAKYRLPSEKEWEYSARAGSSASRFWGDNPDEACTYANVNDRVTKAANDFPFDEHKCNDGHDKTAPVGSLEPNAFGVHDILGNVWEWMGGCWHDTCYGFGDVDTKMGPQDCYFRVQRGGGWNAEPDYVRPALRIRDDEDAGDRMSGFRVLRTFPE